jgi:hypothetical protein
MRRAAKPRIAWVEGVVDRNADHVSVSYGEQRQTVALIAPNAKSGFKVQFLMKARQADPRTSKILNAVHRELTFYLLDIVGRDSWPFVQYHCDTPANHRSIVHWRWHPKPAANP